jgi:hypothetical protein
MGIHVSTIVGIGVCVGYTAKREYDGYGEELTFDVY